MFRKKYRNFVAWIIYRARRAVRQGLGEHAVTALKYIVYFDPNLLIARIVLANSAISYNDYETAEAAVRPRDVDCLPKFRLFLCSLAWIHITLEDPEVVAAYLELAKAKSPESPSVYRVAAQLHLMRGELSASTAAFLHAADRISNLQAKVFEIVQAADSAATAGARNAVELFERVLKIAPNHAYAHFGLVEARKELTIHEPIAGSIRMLLESASVPLTQKVDLHFALGNLHERSGEFAAAFAHWSTANQIRAATSEDTATYTEPDVESRCKVFNRQFVEEMSAHGCDQEFLVCIVGMPRSGTTLVSQILSCHSGVKALGERNDFRALAVSMAKLLRSKKLYPECLIGQNGEAIARIWKQVRDRMTRVAGKCQRIVTKLPDDSFELGLIRILFPKARIIHCLRNPVDTCISCYEQNFTYVPYSRSLFSLQQHYDLYRKIMSHWKETLPQQTIYEIQYENLVANPDMQIRQLLKFVEIPFEESCLNPHQSKNNADTASRWQVRQPIYKSSVNRAIKYREFVSPLLTLETVNLATQSPEAGEASKAEAIYGSVSANVQGTHAVPTP